MLDGIGSKLLIVITIGFVIILLSIGTATDFFSIENKDQSLNIHSIGDIMADPLEYIGEKITVRGYFFQGDVSNKEGYISSEQVQQPIIEGSLNNVDLMIVNISKVNMTFNESICYDFTGTLLSQENTVYPAISVTLAVEKVQLA